MPLDDVGAFFDRIATAVDTAWEDRPQIDLDLDVKEWLADLRESVKLTPTFTDVRRDAQAAMDLTLAEYAAAATAYQGAGPDAAARWATFFHAEYRPEMTRALQDLRAAQVREQLDLVIPVFAALRARLAGLRVMVGDFT